VYATTAVRRRAGRRAVRMDDHPVPGSGKI
jgi:hypothetical protein